MIAADMRLVGTRQAPAAQLFHKLDIQNGSVMVIDTMTITLKNIPKPLHAALKIRARQHGRSLNKEALACLKSAVAPIEVNAQALLVELRQQRAAIPGQLDDSLLHQARHSGRP